MNGADEQSTTRCAFFGPLVWLLAVLLLPACGRGGASAHSEPIILRVGIGGAASQNPQAGVRQFIGNISMEGLLRVDQQGRVQPWLAKSWERSADGLVLHITLRPNIMFHDGSRLNAPAIVSIIEDGLKRSMGKAFADVESVIASASDRISIRMRRPSQFVLDALDTSIQKAGVPPVSTAPFKLESPRPDGSVEMTAFDGYYLGRPIIDRIAVQQYRDIRAAWADLLRNRVDVLYEVGIDAIDSLANSRQVSLYTFDRPYQYIVLLNPNSPKLKSAALRRALNQAIDRAAIVRQGLAGQGTPSTGPVSAHHWAYQNQSDAFSYAPASAAATVSASQNERHLSFTCLTPAEPPYEHLALIVKQQLAAVGVEMNIEEVTPENVVPTIAQRNFEAILVDAVSGWSVHRVYRWWHSDGTQNFGYSNAKVDDALDAIAHAPSDVAYRAGMATFQRAIGEDPPAIFLAWSNRSRAVAHRFNVQPEPGRDILASLRSWKPTTERTLASRN